LEPDAENGDVVVSKHWSSRYVDSLLCYCVFLVVGDFD
jgi:hypothetical protein